MGVLSRWAHYNLSVFMNRAGESNIEGNLTMKAETGVREKFEDVLLLAWKVEVWDHDPRNMSSL